MREGGIDVIIVADLFSYFLFKKNVGTDYFEFCHLIRSILRSLWTGLSSKPVANSQNFKHLIIKWKFEWNLSELVSYIKIVPKTSSMQKISLDSFSTE